MKGRATRKSAKTSKSKVKSTDAKSRSSPEPSVSNSTSEIPKPRGQHKRKLSENDDQQNESTIPSSEKGEVSRPKRCRSRTPKGRASHDKAKLKSTAAVNFEEDNNFVSMEVQGPISERFSDPDDTEHTDNSEDEVSNEDSSQM